MLEKPFVLARIDHFEDDGNPVFEIAFGAGMLQEDVPLVVEMMYEVFLPEIEARRETDNG